MAERGTVSSLRRRGIVGLALLASSFVAAARQEVPRFRSGVDVVQFTVTVLDKQRRPVAGLTAADFEVLVDGKPRPIAAFAGVTLPDDTGTVETPGALVAPDVHTNRLSREGLQFNPVLALARRCD